MTTATTIQISVPSDFARQVGIAAIRLNAAVKAISDLTSEAALHRTPVPTISLIEAAEELRRAHLDHHNAVLHATMAAAEISDPLSSEAIPVLI